MIGREAKYVLGKKNHHQINHTSKPNNPMPSKLDKIRGNIFPPPAAATGALCRQVRWPAQDREFSAMTEILRAIAR